MVIFSLDEFGDFEGIKEEKDAVFIGGIMFDDKENPNCIREERKRIAAYYKEVINEAGERIDRQLRYPWDLHFYNNSSLTKAEMGKAIGTVKSIVAETLGEFLKHGTFRGREPQYICGNQEKELGPREGEYYIYAIIKSKDGKAERIRDNAESLLLDTYASNLYQHMATEAIHRAVFQNPVLEKKTKFSLDIATRVSDTMPLNCDRAKQYKSLGYTGVKKRGELKEPVKTVDGELGVYYKLTNEDIYRTALEEFVANRNDNEAVITSMNVNPIIYNDSVNDMEFLYLADSICSLFSYGLKCKERNSEDEWLRELYSRGEKLLDQDRLLIFAYDSADVYFTKALEAYQAEDYYKALSLTYDAKQRKGEFDRFYYEHWYSFILARMYESRDIEAFSRAVNRVYDSQLTNTYDQNKGLYILEQLEKMVPVMRKEISTPEKQKEFFYLYETLMIAYTHMGKSMEAEGYYRKAKKYANRVSTEEYLRARSILSVCYCDNFEWEKALIIASENAQFTSLLSDMKMKIDGQFAVDGYIAECKAISQLAQVYAFMRDGRAEELFKEALGKMQMKSADYYITESYLLHYYIDKGDKGSFEKYAEDYFDGRTDLNSRFEYIICNGLRKDPIINFRFAMYVFVKSAYVFYINDVDAILWEKIKNIRTQIVNREMVNKEEADSLSEGHPMEIIYKYLVLFAIHFSDTESERDFMQLLKKSIGSSAVSETLYIIERMSELTIAEQKADIIEAQRLLDEIVIIINDNFPKVAQEQKVVKRKDELLGIYKKYFSYMFT